MDNYFIYKNEKYFAGTVVNMNLEVLQKKYGEKIKCLQFQFIKYNEYSNSYYFSSSNKHKYVIDINANDLDQYIDDIVVRSETPLKEDIKINSLEIPGMMNAWIWFIIFFVAILLFKNGILYAALFAIAFFYYRKNKVQKFKNIKRRNRL